MTLVVLTSVVWFRPFSAESALSVELVSSAPVSRAAAAEGFVEVTVKDTTAMSGVTVRED